VSEVTEEVVAAEVVQVEEAIIEEVVIEEEPTAVFGAELPKRFWSPPPRQRSATKRSTSSLSTTKSSRSNRRVA
jgi:hypothetical protein